MKYDEIHLTIYRSKTENFWPKIVDLCSKISWMRGVGWSDEKKIQDLAPAWTISIRYVFLAQSHQICGSELLGLLGPNVPPTLEGLCGRTLSSRPFGEK